MEHYSDIKKNEVLAHCTTQVNSEDDVLGDPTTHSMIASLGFHLDEVPTTATVPETAGRCF